MMKMIRTILPVGQGGFYTEMFQIEDKECLYVYDCGSHTEGEPESTIQSAIPDDKEIEILFISHFDEDHVNGIKELVSHHSIKKVVLPQIDKYHWFYILTNAMDNGGTPHPNLLTDLQNVIKDSAIIQVAPFYEEEQSLGPRTYNEDSNPPSNPIMSGDVLQIKTIWEYVPINTASRQKIETLEKELLPIFQREYAALQSLEDLPDQKVANVISRHTSEINKIYKKIFKDSNKASMCLYSGGLLSGHVFMTLLHCSYCPRCYYNSHFYDFEACLYTGDADLTVKKLTKAIKCLLGKRTERIGTIQIPHHGSKHNSDVRSMDSITDNHPVLLFTSYGTKNRHRHPSLYLLNQLRAAGYCVHEVTEFKHTSLVQVITMH